ncbi:hypothetical protein [Tenacibaculum finnmarkense]|uniref:hypothetical protein n=1 Tax=Tenacibaculum finnmarkense TaxID=2781243 RepID=UPI001EFC167B|nr:hypothetical protein [Tenacibaculum finnmarkense]
MMNLKTKISYTLYILLALVLFSNCKDSPSLAEQLGKDFKEISEDFKKGYEPKEVDAYFPVAIDYNNSTLLRIQTKPELKYFIKEVEVSEKRFYGLLNSIDVSSE